MGGFFVMMDVLKYVFHVDAPDNERRRAIPKRLRTKQKKFGVAIRFIYVHNGTVTASG